MQIDQDFWLGRLILLPGFRTFLAMDRRYREDESLRYITRIEGEKCWRVLYVRGLKKPIQLYFTDRNYDGRKTALKAAMAFRDRAAEIHAPKPGTSPRRNLRYKDKDETQVGIGLAREHRKGRWEDYYWRSAYMEGDKVVRRSWSVLWVFLVKAGWNGVKAYPPR